MSPNDFRIIRGSYIDEYGERIDEYGYEIFNKKTGRVFYTRIGLASPQRARRMAQNLLRS